MPAALTNYPVYFGKTIALPSKCLSKEAADGLLETSLSQSLPEPKSSRSFGDRFSKGENCQTQYEKA